jgi:hypothetical protein
VRGFDGAPQLTAFIDETKSAIASAVSVGGKSTDDQSILPRFREVVLTFALLFWTGGANCGGRLRRGEVPPARA